MERLEAEGKGREERQEAGLISREEGLEAGWMGGKGAAGGKKGRMDGRGVRFSIDHGTYRHAELLHSVPILSAA